MVVSRIIALTLLLTIGALHAGDLQAVEIDVLVQSSSSWNGKPVDSYPQGQPQLSVVRMTIPANTTLSWHKHLMPNAAYILSGHLTVEDRATGLKRVVRTGEAFIEQVGAEHRGYTGDEVCVVIVTYSGTPGMPRSVASPGEQLDH